jgi:hypothetical protein
MKEYSPEVSLRRRKNFRVEGEVIDLRKEEEQIFWEFRDLNHQ